MSEDDIFIKSTFHCSSIPTFADTESLGCGLPDAWLNTKACEFGNEKARTYPVNNTWPGKIIYHILSPCIVCDAARANQLQI